MTRSRATGARSCQCPFLWFTTGGFLAKRLLQKRYFIIGAPSALKLVFYDKGKPPFINVHTTKFYFFYAALVSSILLLVSAGSLTGEKKEAGYK